MTNIVWFRQDLRLRDNPALSAACSDSKTANKSQGNILPIYILDDDNAAQHKMGAASRVWLHHSLTALNKSLSEKLCCYKGKPLAILQKLIAQHNVKAVFWNRCYEPWRVVRDEYIKSQLESAGVAVHIYNGSLLWEPWEIKKANGTPYAVFTPFYRKGCLQASPPRVPLSIPKSILHSKKMHSDSHSVSVAELNLLPQKVRWDEKIIAHWQCGEGAGNKCLRDFLRHNNSGIVDYREGRDLPAQPFISKLSPHLHFGEVSPNQVWYAAHAVDDENVYDFCRQLGWREFSYSQLYFHPTLPADNLQKRFNNFPWQHDGVALTAWQRGQTGVPIVDAGMRELWATGYMHNRVRMITASFLVKNLLVHWRCGERWFWDCLVDADLANNSASWQWVAGCGADAAPYFRIFNPMLQGKKFDADGVYTKKWVPELQALPNQYLFNPWDAPDDVLRSAGIVLGRDYPKPIVDIQLSRQRALDAFKNLRLN